MAKIVTELPKKHGGVGRAEAYPYDEWLDGQIWQLEEGTDYQSKTSSMQTNVRMAAQKRGLKVRVRPVEGGLVIQAFKPQTVEAPTEEAHKPAPRRKKNGA